MHGPEWSDSPIVPTKPANKAGRPAAEPVEGRGGTEGNAELQSTVRTQSRAAVSQAQVRIREAVNRNRGEQLTALLHHITVDVLRAAFFALKKRAAPGIDAVTWDMYEERREENLRDLHVRVHAGAYRALPSRRTYIPKADGRQRPLGIAAIEDKIVQAAVVIILTPIYEAEFLGFSYGSGRGAANMMRWMHSRTGSKDGTSAGSSTPTFDRSSTRSATIGWSASWSIGLPTEGSSASSRSG